jgi:hypothetical protein
MGFLGTAITLAGGPLGILAALVAGSAAYFLLMRDNTDEAKAAQERARASTDALNAALGVFHSTAAPSAASQAIALAKANYDLADSAAAAARGELAKRRAILDARSAQYADVTDPEAALIVGAKQDEAVRGLNQQMEELTRAEARLSDAMRKREGVARSITGTMSDAMTAAKDLQTQLSVTLDLPSPFSIPTSSGSSGGGAGGGGGATDGFADKLAALNEGLQTEREAVDAWYAESQAILADRRAMEILGEEGHREALLTVEEQYQRKLAELRMQSQEALLTNTGQFFGGMAQLAQAGGEKFLGISKAFALAEAAVGIWQGAAKALALPFPMNLGAWGQVLALGAKAISGITSARPGSASVSGGGGGGSSRAATPAPAQRDRSLRIEILGDGMFADQLRSHVETIADALFDEHRSGGTRVVIG